MTQYKAIIIRYTASAGNQSMQFDLPPRVTVTGAEDHFARAYEDAHMIIMGLRSAEQAIRGAQAETDPARFRIYEISEY